MDTTSNTTDPASGPEAMLRGPEHLKQEKWPPLIKWGLPAVLIAIALAFFFFHKKAPLAPYRTEKITQGSLNVSVTATGTLQPTNEVDVGSELSGTIRKIYVDFNDTVKAGQVLAELDTTRLNAQVLQMQSSLAAAQARVQQTEATLKEARTTLQRLLKVRELSNNKLPSQQDLDTAEAAVSRGEADVSSAKAAVEQAKATLDGARTDLGKARIVSPINGVVLLRSVDQGQTVAATMQAPVLFTLAQDLKVMELKVDVDEADVGKVQVGQHATFTVDAYPERRFNAKITQVHFAPSNQKSASSTAAATTTTGVVTYETELEVDNSDLVLRPGMTATAVITVQQVDNTLLVPNAALRFVPPEVKARLEQMRTGRPGGGPSLVGTLVPTTRPNARPPLGGPNSPFAAMRGMARVWVVGADGKPQMLTFKAGASDGTRTQLVSVGSRMTADMKFEPLTADDLKAGTDLIVDVNTVAPAKP